MRAVNDGQGSTLPPASGFKTHNWSTGTIIDGKWVLIECIGKGGMGEVYRAPISSISNAMWPSN
jgi:hypothetical protein